MQTKEINKTSFIFNPSEDEPSIRLSEMAKKLVRYSILNDETPAKNVLPWRIARDFAGKFNSYEKLCLLNEIRFSLKHIELYCKKPKEYPYYRDWKILMSYLDEDNEGYYVTKFNETDMVFKGFKYEDDYYFSSLYETVPNKRIRINKEVCREIKKITKDELNINYESAVRFEENNNYDFSTYKILTVEDKMEFPEDHEKPIDINVEEIKDGLFYNTYSFLMSYAPVDALEYLNKEINLIDNITVGKPVTKVILRGISFTYDKIFYNAVGVADGERNFYDIARYKIREFEEKEMKKIDDRLNYAIDEALGESREKREFINETLEEKRIKLLTRLVEEGKMTIEEALLLGSTKSINEKKPHPEIFEDLEKMWKLPLQDIKVGDNPENELRIGDFPPYDWSLSHTSTGYRFEPFPYTTI